MTEKAGLASKKRSRARLAFAGMEWIIVLLVVVLLFFGGAKKIPEFAQSIGRARGEFERGKLEVEKEIAAERAKAAQAPAAPAPGDRKSVV